MDCHPRHQHLPTVGIKRSCENPVETRQQPPRGQTAPTFLGFEEDVSAQPGRPLRQGRDEGRAGTKFTASEYGSSRDAEHNTLGSADQESGPLGSRESTSGPPAALPLPRTPQRQNSGIQGPAVLAFVLVTRPRSRVLSPQGPHAALGNRRHSSERRHQRSRVCYTCPADRGLNEPVGPTWRGRKGRHLVAAPRLPSPSPSTPGSARTGTYPSCRRGRTHSTPEPAPRTRSQFAAAASLASCELCAAGGDLGAPSRSAWVPSLGEDGSFSGRSTICGPAALGLERATRRSEARISGPKLHGPRGGSAGKRREGRWGRAAWPELRVPLAACAHRAPWLRGEEATPARWRWRPWLAGLAQSGCRSRYLAAAPAILPGAARGEHSVRPRAPRCRSHSQHPPPPSLAAGPASDVPLLPDEPSPVAQCVQWEGRPDPRDPRPSPRAVSTPALLGASSPRELSLRLLAPAPASRGRGASCLQLTPPSPPLPPASHPPGSTCTPPLRRARPCAPPFPGEAQLLTNIIVLFSPFLSLPCGAEPSPPLEPCEAAAENR